MRSNTERKGIVFTIIITIVFFLLLGAVSAATGFIFADSIHAYDLENYIWFNGLAQLVLSIVVVYFMWKIHLFDKKDWGLKGIGRGLFMGLVGIVFALILFVFNFVGSIAYAQFPDLSYFLACIFIAFTTGLFEELLVRAFAYNSFKKYFSVKKSIVWSSVLFGVLHIVNLTGYDLASILSTLSQVISACIVGMYFALVYEQSKSLWSVIIIHSMIDGATFVLYSLLSVEAFQSSSSEMLSNWDVFLQSFIIPLVIMVPFLVAVIIKWRKLGDNIETDIDREHANEGM